MAFPEPAAGAAEQTLPDAPGMLFDIGRLLQGSRYRNEAMIRAQCRNAYLGNDRALCRILGRYKMYVDTNDVGMASHLLLDGFWEMWVTEAMIRHVPLGAVALDIGANCGYFSVLLAELVGPKGTLLAFEPNKRMARLLQRTLDVNGFGSRATVHEVALGDSDGSVTLVVPANEPKNAYVAAGEVEDGVRVVQRRLDSIPEAMAADFIKIDVEGAEEGLWRGMAGLLAQERPLTIFLEFTPGRYADAGRFLDEILGHGFALNLVTFTKGVVPVTRAAVLAGDPRQDQMLALIRG